ncbi:MAG: MFS transporter [Chloroflexi bacterium]|nr:MFS transporter [Chloroflexota bacterium]
MLHYRNVALALATVAFTLCFAVWGLIAPLAPQFKEMYDLSSTEAGILVAVPVLLGSLARIPVGLLTDRYSARIVFTALLLFLLIPTLLIGFANSYPLLLFWGFWLGTAGSTFAIGVPYVAQWFPPAQQGFALGIYGMGNIGTALSSFLAPMVSTAYSWPTVFWLFLPALLLMAVIFALFGREAAPPAQLEPIGTRLKALTRPLVWILTLFYCITFGGFVALSIYLPTFLVDTFGLMKADAGARTAGFVIVATLTRPVGGLLSDRWGGGRVLTWIFVVIAALAVVLAFGPEMRLATVAFLGIAASLGLGNGAVFKLVSQYYPTEVGTVTGLVGAGGGIGGFFPPIVMGFVRDATGSFAIGFMLLSEFALAALILNLSVIQRKANDLTK